MRRAVPVIAATAGGLALLTNFHTAPAGTVRTTAATTTSTIEPAPTTASTTATGPTSNPGAPTTTTTLAARTIDGPDVLTDYGDVQVRVVLRGTRLVDVQALALPSDRARSQRISNSAGPKLRQEALQAQSARINLVSGATYTSEGYIQSLQAALDQAHR